MSRFPETLIAAAVLLLVPVHASAQDAAAGEKVFNKCRSCHMVGEDAKNRVGPHLNDLFGRTAGGVEAFKYSKAMEEAGAGGLTWTEETLADFLIDPRGLVKGTRMAFAGLKKEEEIANLTAYLKSFSGEAAAAPDPEEAKAEQSSVTEPEARGEQQAKPAAAEISTHGLLHLGRPASEEEIAAWDIDIRPDGAGLPEGRGTVAEGEEIFAAQCASCHGDFGEAIGRWPALAGGFDTLTRERPVKTVGSYWPYLSTVYDYIRRAMPFGNARSLSDDDVYALTAYVLYLNDIVTDEDFELSDANFGSIEMPNANGFVEDDRHSEAHYEEAFEPCMKDCKPGKAEILMHATVLDVTPEGEGEDSPSGAID